MIKWVRKMKDKLAIIGASYLQEPLIERAKELGYETHVFAWAANDVGEKSADYFYPISIIEKEEILDTCRKLGICGICTIASDLAAVTVNYVADKLGLPGNSPEASLLASNKFYMRKAFFESGCPSPKSIRVENVEDLDGIKLTYPIIVKPLDRSGSRGITKLENNVGLAQAIETAKEQGFEKHALVEEFATGNEYSVECITYHGEHHFLAMTKKYTTGAPHFIETGHVEPSGVSERTLSQVKDIVFHALDALKITDSASHTELKISDSGDIKLIEIGGRMGGDYIGSNLVRISTGIDFVRAVIQVAVGEAPDLEPEQKPEIAAVRFVLNDQDRTIMKKLEEEHPEYIALKDIHEGKEAVTDSSTRFGVCLMHAAKLEYLLPYMPEQMKE